MNAEALQIEKNDVHKLLLSASGDGALLYLYLRSGNDIDQAGASLNMNPSQLRCATATLRQLGLWQEKKPAAMIGERPRYTESDVVTAMDRDTDFCRIYSEVQRQLGKQLNTEEMKILLGFVRYLGMSGDVISLLVSHCKERASRKGNLRNPSLRTIEKEAYAWAERGIDTLEEAVAYIQSQHARYTRVGRLMELLQIRGRNLTAGEEKYANQWLEWGFDEEALTMAYERTCLNTGGMAWPYMHKILARWREAGLLTGAQIKNGDQKPANMKASGKLGQAELAAIQRIMQEE